MDSYHIGWKDDKFVILNKDDKELATGHFELGTMYVAPGAKANVTFVVDEVSLDE
jgi:hypothetical protein